MRLVLSLMIFGMGAGLAGIALAQTTPDTPAKPPKEQSGKPIEVTADQSLEWYQEQHIYVARGHARAVRNEMVVDADLLTAHERDKPETPKGQPKPPKPPKDPNAKSTDNGSGDIDIMTADGNVRITDPKSRTTGDHAVYNLDNHTIVVTGNNLKYETEKQTVTAKDSLEYYEDKHVAVARGHAVEDDPNRHVEGDVMTAEFREGPNGANDLQKITTVGHVTVVTKNDVVHGDRGVYDAARNMAIINDHVRITRPDGTELTGDVAEIDFTTNQSRLLNSGSGRVRALLPPKSTDKAKAKSTSAAATTTGTATTDTTADTP